MSKAKEKKAVEPSEQPAEQPVEKPVESTPDVQTDIQADAQPAAEQPAAEQLLTAIPPADVPVFDLCPAHLSPVHRAGDICVMCRLPGYSDAHASIRLSLEDLSGSPSPKAFLIRTLERLLDAVKRQKT